MKYIAYYRVSTSEQGDSGLGIEAQKGRVRSFLGEKPLVSEFVEVESGKNDLRPQLKAALDLCRKEGHTLVIAKLDRLSRNLTFISSLMDAKTRFVCADMPEANEFTIHIFAALAQAERKLISERTKHALGALKEKGVRLGNPQNLGGKRATDAAAIANHARKWNNYRNVSAAPYIKSLKEQGFTLQNIADRLNEERILAPKGGLFTPMQVSRLLK